MYLSALQTQIPGHFSKWLLLPTPVRLACYNCSKSLLTDTLSIQTAFPSLQTISRDNAVWASHPPLGVTLLQRRGNESLELCPGSQNESPAK